MQHAGHVVTISAADYPCFPCSMRDNELRNRDQTFRDFYRASIAIIASDVTVAKGDTVTYKGEVRRVLDFSDTGDGLQRVLHLGDRYHS